jgi:hypothetical protein
VKKVPRENLDCPETRDLLDPKVLKKTCKNVWQSSMPNLQEHPERTELATPREPQDPRERLDPQEMWVRKVCPENAVMTLSQDHRDQLVLILL